MKQPTDTPSIDSQMAKEVISILGTGEKTDHFLYAATKLIEFYRDDVERRDWSSEKNQKTRAKTLIKNIKRVEDGLLDSSATHRHLVLTWQLGAGQGPPRTFGEITADLQTVRMALESQLPSISDKPGLTVKNEPRNILILQLIRNYERIFGGRAGRGRSSKFPKALLPILKAAGLRIEDPRDWVDAARKWGKKNGPGGVYRGATGL